LKYFLDTEFNEIRDNIQLISIGIKCEDGRKFYAEVPINNISKNFNKWVKDNVLPYLEYYKTRTRIPYYNDDPNNVRVYADREVIKNKLLEFIKKDDKNIQFWGYYADYDWVLFAWIFGAMIDLPEHFPMYCNDIKQLAEELGNPKIKDPVNEHNALVDAIWNEKYYNFLIKKKLQKEYL
jgi:hypothetical protein